MPQFKNIFAGLKQLYSPVTYDKTIRFPNASGVSGVFVSDVLFTQVSGGLIYTGSVAIPANTTVLDVQFKTMVLWGGTTAVLNLGDTDVTNGYFAAIDVKVTDLLVGEILGAGDDGLWGGKPGAHLTAAGRRGSIISGNSGNFYGVANTITGVITVGTPGTSTVGRSIMTVIYAVGIPTTATNTV